MTEMKHGTVVMTPKGFREIEGNPDISSEALLLALIVKHAGGKMDSQNLHQLADMMVRNHGGVERAIAAIRAGEVQFRKKAH